MRQLWPAHCRYVCLDIEMPKLQGFRSKVAGGLALQTDATRMPIASGCADSVVCMAVAHHLTDAMLTDVLGESVRVLKPGGRMFFLDPVLARDRIVGRMIWRLDRGSYPRTAEALQSVFSRHLKIAHWEQFAIHHEYVMGIGVRI
jgi:SAM-dependent methyltransferase